jgi:TPR repeat protein
MFAFVLFGWSLAFAGERGVSRALEAEGLTPVHLNSGKNGAYAYTATDRDGQACMGAVMTVRNGFKRSYRVSKKCDFEPTSSNYPDRMRAACERSSGEACERLGEHLGQTPEHAAEAVAPFEKGCSLGNMGACFNRGLMLTTGIGGTTDAAAAAPWFKQACDGKLGDACFELAVLKSKGKAGPTSADELAQLGKQGCDAGSGASCAVWAQVTISGKARPEEADAARAALEPACAQGVREACQVLQAFPKK